MLKNIITFAVALAAFAVLAICATHQMRQLPTPDGPRFNVIVGGSAGQAGHHSYCILIGPGAVPTGDRQLVIGTHQVTTSRSMTDEEYAAFRAALVGPEPLTTAR